MATHIRRREFVAALGGAALPAAWPRAAGHLRSRGVSIKAAAGAAFSGRQAMPVAPDAKTGAPRPGVRHGPVRRGVVCRGEAGRGEASLTKGSARAEPFSFCPARCGRCRSPGRRTTIRRASLARARLSGHGPRAPRAEHAAAVSRRRASISPIVLALSIWFAARRRGRLLARPVTWTRRPKHWPD
jgi:hypothetical protein